MQIQYIKSPFERAIKGKTDSSFALLNPHTLFKNTDLENYCPRKLFEVVFANELTPQCSELLEGIIEYHHTKEIDSNIVFITRKSIIDFVKEIVNNCGDNLEHPPTLLDHLRRVCSDLHQSLRRNDEISRKQLALIMKHKIINEMYVQYATAAKADHEICQKEELLKKLLRLDYQKQIKFSEMDVPTSNVKLKISRSKQMDSGMKLRMDDYTSYSLPDNLHGSDDLKDHVYFYVFVGFQDPCLIKLLTRYRVPVNCVLQISRKFDVENSHLTYFWKKMNEISENREKFKMLEDTVQMRYVYDGEIPNDDNRKPIFFEGRLKELEELLMKILELKRKHIFYIKNLLPYKFENVDLNFGPFLTYEKSLNDIPLEYITIPYIVHSILSEVEKNVEGPTSKDISFFNQSKIQSTPEICEITEKEKRVVKIPCPFTLNHFKRNKHKNIRTKEKNSFRKLYEGDILNFNMYQAESKKARNVAFCDSKTLMNQIFFHSIQLLKNAEDIDSFLPHRHQEGSPSSRKSFLSQEQINHFLNLMYLNSMKVIDDCSKSKEDPEKQFLCTPYEINKFFLPTSSNVRKESFNWYSKFDSMLSTWREPLSMSTLAQWLFEAQQEFSEVNYRYCDCTNTLVVHFHQKLWPSGARTKIWRESLRTLTCFRDFCSFYYLQEDAWFENYQPMKYINHQTYITNEEKYVFERLIESNHNYKEYEKYLIPYYYCDNFDLEESICPNSESVKKFSHIPPVMKPNFDNIIDELKQYPSSGELSRNGAKLKSNSTLIAYDDKPQRFGLVGATHDFFSHDGVQVTIDTCRFFFEDFKLRMAIAFDGHHLIGHHKSRHLDSHLMLRDGTVIKFILTFPKSSRDVDSCQNSDEIEMIKSILGFNLKNFRKDTETLPASNINLEELPIFRSEVKHVIPLHKEDLDEMKIDRSSLLNKIKKIPHEKNMGQDVKILNQLKNSHVFYKYVDYGKLKYLRRKYKLLEIPYSSCIRRILRKQTKQKCKLMHQRRKLKIKYFRTFPDDEQKDSPHIKLTFPNGLIVESFTTSENKDIIAVKQTHLEKHKYEPIMLEDYRLFLSQGRVLVRFTNGNMKILNSEGTILEFKQNQTDDCDEEKCLKSFENCRKMFCKLSLSKNIISHDIHEHSRSRRGHLTPSKELVNSEYLEALSPLNTLYSSIYMYTLEGYVLKLREQSILKQQFAKLLKNCHYQTGEMFLNRTDGLKMLNRDNGDRIVIFPDGTKITKTVQLGKEPKFFTNDDEEGWIVINHTYLYEHPYYCPIKFDAHTDTSTILLKQRNEVVLSKSSVLISFSNECELSVHSENMFLRKCCPKCGAACTCEVKLNWTCLKEDPFQFLVCEDSYNKEFIADSSGRCQINKSFIEGELNSKNCNHVLKRNYHKAFLINDDLTGYLLWNDNMVKNELEKMENLTDQHLHKGNVEKFTDTSSRSIGIRFTKNYFRSLKGKYLWLEYLQPFEASWLDEIVQDKKDVKYQVCRKVFNVLHERDTNILYRLVKKLLERDDEKTESGTSFHGSSKIKYTNST